MDCSPDTWTCEALHKLGVHGFAARTVESLAGGPLRIALILLVGLVVARVGSRLAQRSVVSLASRSPLRDPSPRANLRAQTLAGVVGSAVRVMVWVVVVLTVVDVFTNVGPLLAGASIAGVAIGFGAQSLVRDFLSGFFVLVEDQYGVGDSVTLGEVTGTVEDVNLRVTRLRAADGTVWFVPNGEIRKVGNAAKDWAKAIVDITVPVSADVANTTAAIVEEAAAFASDEAWSEALLGAPEILGVEEMNAECLTIRVTAKTVPSERAKVARELRARLGARLKRDEATVRSADPVSDR